MSARILVAGLFHETHSFVEEKTGLAQFLILAGEKMLHARGDASPLDGVLEVAEEAGWKVIPAIDMRAAPGGTADDEVVEFFWQSLSATARDERQGGIDGIFLVLHGAMVSDSFDDVEGEILRRIRQLPGAAELPVFGVYDLHANFSEAMAQHADCLVAYRENPHTDARQAAVDAARLLQRAIQEKVRPRMWYRAVPVVWVPSGTGTGAEPMRALEAGARKVEREHADVWAVNVNAGFSFSDSSSTGVSFCISGTCEETLAEEVLRNLASVAWDLREEGCVREEPVSELLDRILPVEEGPVVLVEPSDNIGGGAPGDGTGLLRALLTRHVEDAVVVINDPASASAAAGAGAGGQVRLAVGGRGSRLDEGPVELDFEVLMCTDGKFKLEDSQSHLASMGGTSIDMGISAVVRHKGVRILLTSQRTPPFDLGQLRSQGIEPSEAKVIGVKAAVAHRRAYDPVAKVMYWVDTPGPCSSQLERLPYQRLRRPVYPLDGDETIL